MKTPYLIQKGTIADRDYKKGFDSVVNLEYMGYAEYEFGAVQDSLKKIREDINEYTYLDVPIFGKTVTVFCNENQKSEIKDLLTRLGNDEFHTKGHSGFKDFVNPSKLTLEFQQRHPQRENFWWDLDNNIMFWKKEPDFETKFKTIMKQSDLNIGDKVHYIPFEGCDEDQFENGYVKEIPEHTETSVRVVFHWFGDNENPLEYTSHLTDLTQLKKGWVDNPKNKLSLTYNIDDTCPICGTVWGEDDCQICGCENKKINL